MDLRPHIHEDRLSHAYIVESEREEGVAALRALFLSFNIVLSGNPDYHEYKVDTLLLEHAQELRREQGLRGADGAKKIFVLAFNSITNESQNALLKTLEEPTEHTHFFFVVRTSAMLLPTVLSRMQLVRAHGSLAAPSLFATEFLAAGVAERMKMIERMTKAKTDDKPRAKEEARVFVGALEELLYPTLIDTHDAHALADVIVARRELSGRAPSVKLLLEHLALTLPKLSVPEKPTK